MALMTFLDSEVYNDKTCSKTCLKNYESLKKQFDDLLVKLNETEFKATTYKREYACGLVDVERESVSLGHISISNTCGKFIRFKVVIKNKLLESQITDKSKKGLGYNVVSPPHPLIYNRPTKLDLSYSGLDEFKEPEFKGYGPRDIMLKSTIDCDNESDNYEENTNDSLVEFVKPKKNEKPVRKPVRYFNQKVNTVRPRVVNTARPYTTPVNTVRANGVNAGKPQMNDKGFIDSGCSRHMTGNIAYLSNFKEFDGGYVTFGGGAYGGRISGKGTLKTNTLDFKDVYFVKELKFNLFSVSQMCDKKNYVLFTNSEFLVLSSNFKLPDESQILLKIPRKGNMYSFDVKSIVPKESLTCLVAKATLDKSMLWHRRLGHINFKNMNKLVKENLVRGLPLKHFENDQTCVACLKRKQHRASSTKDETSEILKNFLKEIENLVDKKVKIIKCDNGTKFKNKVMDDFWKEKGIRREYSIARTPQQNGVAERRNRTLIEAARTMLADSKLPTTFWTEAVSTACYVQNRVLIVKPHNKTPYELFRGFKPTLSFIKPFGCHVTILNTLDNLGKFDGKSDEGFFIGYSLSSKAFRVYNTRTRKVEENLHVGFLENKPMIEGNGPKWMFDIDSLTQSICYVPVTVGTSTNESADASYFDSPSKEVDNDDEPKQVEDGPNNESDDKDKSEDDSSPKEVNTARQQVNIASPDVNIGISKLNTVDPSVNTASSYDQDSSKDMLGVAHTLEATHIEFFSDEHESEVDLGNIPNSYAVPNTPSTRIHKDHLIKNVIGDVKSSVHIRRMT
ncbi:putative ribonuclease H-like domain-containing protein [Tanacetum coccineum]